jgi:hypothetical protein
MLTKSIAVFFIIGGCIKMLSLYEENVQEIPAPEEDPVENTDTIIAVENIDKTIEVESISFWDLNWRSLTEGEKNVLEAFAISLLFLVLNGLVMLLLFRRYRHRKEEKEKERKDLEFIIERCEHFVQGMRASIEVMKEGHEERWAEFRNEMEAVNSKKWNVEILFTEFKNLMDVVKKKIKEENHGTLQNFTDRIENNMKAKNDRLAELAKAMKEIGINVARCLIPKTEVTVLPARKESPVEMRAISIPCTAPSKAMISEEQRLKKNRRISKIPVRVGSTLFATLGRFTDYVAVKRKISTCLETCED